MLVRQSALFLIAFLVLVAPFTRERNSVCAQGQPTYSLNEAQGLFILKTLEFVEWPATVRRTEWVIGVYNDPAMLKALSALAQKYRVSGLPVRVRPVNAPTEWVACALVFSGDIATAKWESARAQLKGAALVTVSNRPDSARRGFMLELYLEGGKIRFAINRREVELSPVKIRAQMMKLAKIVP